MNKKIIIIGAGYGGMAAARSLIKASQKQSFEITLIDRSSYHLLLTDIHEVAGRRVDSETVLVDIRKVFAEKPIKIITKEVTSVDRAKREVTLEDQQQLSYDYLIVGAGSKPTYWGIEGAEEWSFPLWSYNDSLTIREHIVDCFEKARAESDPKKRAEYLTFAVCGAGFTGVEMVGELAEWSRTLASEYEIKRSEIKLYLIDAVDSVCPILPPALIKKAEKRLKKMGVSILLSSPITKVTETFFEIGKEREYRSRTLIWCSGVESSDLAAQLEGLEKRGRNRIVVNSHMQCPESPEIYAVGDNLYFEEEERPLPQIVETALQTAEVAAHNISATEKGEPLKEFRSNYHGYMVSIGSRYAVANLMGVNFSGFLAMGMKHLVNLHYLFETGGFFLFWRYMRHEFFHIKKRRSLIGGHATKRSYTVWLLFLRVFIGLLWLDQGMEKVSKGWLTTDQVYILPQGASMPKNDADSSATDTASSATDTDSSATDTTSSATDTGSSATDTASSATDASSSATDTASSATDTTSAATDAGSGVASSGWGDAADKPSKGGHPWYLKPIRAFSFLTGTDSYDNGVWPVPLLKTPPRWYVWVMDTFVAPIAPFVQKVIVLMEIGIGLALMGGLFTFLAAAASLLLCLNFILSSLTGSEIFWYIFGALALMAGSGRVVGLDYYVMPLLKEFWNSRQCIRKKNLRLP